ncbi:unnamed protein product, partial [Iphiclides podalirius]
MDYNVEDGLLPREFIEYDFAEDALDFEKQLAEARDIKFTQTLTEPLTIGSHIICTGTPTEDLPWFAINIGCGDPESGRNDIAVHFNVRLPQCYVVRNTRRHDKWGSEETTAFRLRPTLHSFAVDLLDACREWPRANVIAHANVRAHSDAQLPRQLVVLNAWLGGWGPERRQRTARLVPSTPTTIRIVRGSGEWSVYAEDLLIGELEHRAAPDGVKAVRIRGDLYPEQIYICPSSTSPV